MARRPKGSYFRNTPDWFFQRAASGGGSNPSSVSMFAVTDLFNDAQDGSLLYVYDLYIQNTSTQSIRVQQVSGHVTGTNGPAGRDAPGFPVKFDLGQLPGHLYFDQVASRTSPGSDPYITSVNAPVVDRINPPGPLAIIPPGWSLRLISNQTQFGFICWFYWVVLADSGG